MTNGISTFLTEPVVGGGGGGGPGKRVKIRVHHVPSVATKIGVCREKITPHLPKYFPLSCDAKILGEK